MDDRKEKIIQALFIGATLEDLLTLAQCSERELLIYFGHLTDQSFQIIREGWLPTGKLRFSQERILECELSVVLEDLRALLRGDKPVRISMLSQRLLNKQKAS